MNPSPFVRHTFINTVVFGFFYYLPLYSSDQTNFQRICTVKSIKKAQRVISYNAFGIFFIYFLIFFAGLAAYANYAGCDPMALGIIKRKEEIIPYFVMDKLSFIPGLPGIFVATLIGGSLSSISTLINGIVAQIWRDICLRFNHFKAASPSYATLVNKILSLVVGSSFIGLAVLSLNAKSLIELTFVIISTFNGPIFGVFLIGFFCPRCNVKGVWTGFITSTVLILWISLGSFLYKKPQKFLPFSSDECDFSNFTSENTSVVIKDFVSLTNSSIKDTTTDE
ncbi:Sodium-coupled monocarboxylate transporter 2 [Armadillidium vulgare]|nr:Sodium-coupled monocarboxylate transporter 2 [Armadillidium vulgare]